MKNRFTLEHLLKKLYRSKEHQIDQHDLWLSVEASLPRKKNRFVLWWFFGLLILLPFSFVIFSDYKISNEDKSLNDLPEEIISEQSSLQLEKSKDNTDKTMLISPQQDRTRLHQSAVETEMSLESTLSPIVSNSEEVRTKVDATENHVNFEELNATVEDLTPLNFQDQIKRQTGNVYVSSKKENNIPKSNLQSSKNLRSAQADKLFQHTFAPRTDERFSKLSTSPAVGYVQTVINPSQSEVRYILSANQGVSSYTLHFASTSDEFKSNYEKHTTSLLGYSANVLFGLYPGSKKWRITMGLDYTILRSRLDWSGVVNQVTTGIASDSATFFTINGLHIYNPGELNVTTTETRSIRHYNSIRRISIPFMVGWEPIQSRHTCIGIQAGFLINLNQKANGKFIDQNNTVIENQVIDAYFKSNVHAINFGAYMQRRISDKFVISGSLNYAVTGDIFSEDAISGSARILNGRLGINYLF